MEFTVTPEKALLNKRSFFVEVGMFESKAEVEAYFEGEKIECLLCGRMLKSLSTHLSRIHDVECDEYREKFGLPYSKGLVSSVTSGKCSAGLHRRIERGDKTLMPISQVANIGQQTKNRALPLYAQNEHGARITEYNHGYKLSVSSAEEFIEAMEKTRRAQHVIATLPQFANEKAFMLCIEENPQLKERYLVAQSNAVHLLSVDDILTSIGAKGIISNMIKFGLKHRDVAKILNISKTTVTRINKE